MSTYTSIRSAACFVVDLHRDGGTCISPMIVGRLLWLNLGQRNVMAGRSQTSSSPIVDKEVTQVRERSKKRRMSSEFPALLRGCATFEKLLSEFSE